MTFKIKDGLKVGTITVIDANGNILTNAATATNATSASQIDNVEFNNSASGNPVSAPDTLNSNGIGYVTNISLFSQTDGALYSQAYGSAWQHQIYGDYRTGQLAIRGKNNDTWQAWRSVLDSSNYTNWAATAGHNHSGTYVERDEVKSFGTIAVQAVAGSSVSCTTTQFISWLETQGFFDYVHSYAKCSWDYAGNNDISDTGFGANFELAGCVIETWTDNSDDTVRGNITVRITAPTTGGTAGSKILIYNDQGSSYSPGWRQVWNSNTDGSSSGLDADLLDGLDLHTARNNEVNKVVRTDGNGYLQVGYVNSSNGDEANASTPARIWGTNGSDSYLRTYLVSSFNAATATKLQTARTINGVSFDGSANVTVPTIYDTGFKSIINPGGAIYNTSTASVTGAIAITLPVGMTGTMLRMTVRIYEYTTNESFDVYCGGYNYATGNTWTNSPFAYIIGNPGVDRRFTIRFGYTAAGKAVVYIGELASVWSYPQVFVTDVQCGFGGLTTTFTSGWTVGFQATAFENVTATISNSQVGYALSTNTANTTVLRDGSGNFSAGTITATLTGNASSATNVYVTQSNNTVNFDYLLALSAGVDQNISLRADASGPSWNPNTQVFSAPAKITGNTLESRVATGTAPITVTSTTVVSNLNADLLDGNHASAFATANQTMYIGTTAVAINRASAALSLTGINIDGTAGTATNQSGGTVSATSANANYIGVNNTTSTNGYGISLYNGAVAGQPTYGIMFQGTATFGTHGSVTADWATYFTMNTTANRGWVFKAGSGSAGNVASIDVAGTAVFNGNVTAYSDARVKTDIQLIDNAIHKVKQVRGVTYTRTDSGDRQTGVIAQELLKVLPEAVIGTEDTMYSVAYGNISGLLIEAIKEQQQIIDSQEERISRLEALIASKL